jgi:hypothetical protein
MVTNEVREQIIKEALDEIRDKLRGVTVDTKRDEFMEKMKLILNKAISGIKKQEKRYNIESILYKIEEEFSLMRAINDKDKTMLEGINKFLNNIELPEIIKYNRPQFLSQLIEDLRKIIQLNEVNKEEAIVKILRKVFDDPEVKPFHFNPNDTLKCPICKEPQINRLVLDDIILHGNNGDQKYKAFTGKLTGHCEKNIAKSKSDIGDQSEWVFYAYVFLFIDKQNNSELRLNVVEFNLEEELRERGLDF